MLKLPSKTVELIKNKLQKLQKEVQEDIKEVEQDDPALEVVVEPSEPGTDSYIAEAHTKYLVFENNLKKIGANIKKALEKMKKGTYGKCEQCGKQIEISRLLVMPTATHCLSCCKKNKVIY